MGLGNADIEQDLQELPEKVADALQAWRMATLDREKCEGLLYSLYKGEDKERTATEIRALVHASDARYSCILAEIKAEANYERLYESLMCAKKKADLRTAY